MEIAFAPAFFPLVNGKPAIIRQLGEVAEWSNALDLKSSELQGSVGSNPTLSVNTKPYKNNTFSELLNSTFFNITHFLLNAKDISGKEGTGNREKGRRIDNLWIRIDFNFNFWRCLNNKTPKVELSTFGTLIRIC